VTARTTQTTIRSTRDASRDPPRNLIERNGGGPIEIYDDPDAWIIPEASVRWVKIHDPDTSSRREVGFRMSGGDER
jgi:hypothetical protein